MGVIRQLTCPSCRKEWELCLGHGVRHGVLGRVMKAFSEDTQRKIAAEVDTGQLPLFHFNYKAAVCSRCQNMVAVPVLELIEKERLLVGECPDCRGSVEILDEDFPIICPGCRNGELEVVETGRWD